MQAKWINLYLSNRLCPFRFNFLTVEGIYAELQPRRDMIFPPNVLVRFISNTQYFSSTPLENVMKLF